MLAIVRALMAKPRLLLLDEPSMGLAPNLVQEIFLLIKQINKERGTTITLRRGYATFLECNRFQCSTSFKFLQ